MQFEYYVLNYNWNKKCVEKFNVFRNIRVQEWTEKAIKKYLRSPKNYSVKNRKNDEILYGFEALCEEIRSTIQWQERGRREYEISVSDAFIEEIYDVVNDIKDFETYEQLKTHLEGISKRNPKLEKWDCYMQCEPNIEMITRECIYQYKKQLKEQKNNV